MSVLLKGIDLPKEGRITLQIGYDGSIYSVSKFKLEEEKYETYSHAVEVPTPHGRLIDADKLIEELKECMDAAYDNWEYGTATGYSNSIESVVEADTIIEAEGSEE